METLPNDPILAAMVTKLAAKKKDLLGATDDVDSAVEALTMAQSAERQVRIEIRRLEQAIAALQGSETEPDVDQLLLTALNKTHKTHSLAAPPVDSLDWSKPSPVPRMIKMKIDGEEQDILLEPGWTLQKNSFGEDALISPGAPADFAKEFEVNIPPGAPAEGFDTPESEIFG